MRKKLMNKATDPAGFSIIELLVVIVVIGILSIIAITAFGGASRRAGAAKIATDLRYIETALNLWAVDQGFSEWPLETTFSLGENPRLAEIARNDPDGLGKFYNPNELETTELIEANITGYTYDQDGAPSFGACTGTDTVKGFNVIIGNSADWFDDLDELIDGSDGQCGKLFLSNQTHIYVKISEDLSVE